MWVVNPGRVVFLSAAQWKLCEGTASLATSEGRLVVGANVNGSSVCLSVCVSECVCVLMCVRLCVCVRRGAGGGGSCALFIPHLKVAYLAFHT